LRGLRLIKKKKKKLTTFQKAVRVMKNKLVDVKNLGTINESLLRFHIFIC